jgi:hypothetical protein
MPPMPSTEGTSPEAESSPPSSARGRERQRAVAFIFALLPGALIVYLGFTAGGYYPGSTATAAAVLAVLLALRFLLLPATRFSPALIAACAAMGAFVIWTYMSQDWSGSVVRASLSADRALLYFLTLVLFGSLPADDRRLRWMIRSVAVGIVAVCAVGVGSRLLPGLIETTATGFHQRLGYPLSYWNALGIFAGIGLIFCVHLAKSGAETRTWRTLAAAATPMLAVVLYLTLSRGAMLAVAAGLVVYLVVARNQGTIPMLLSVVPTSAIAVLSAYRADILVTPDYATHAAAGARGQVLAVLLACTAVTALVRFVLARYEEHLTVETPLTKLSGGIRMVLGAGAAVVVVAVALAVFGSQIRQSYDEFFEASAVPVTTGKERLSGSGGSGRSALWDVATASFHEDALKGAGAGTFALDWLRSSPPQAALNAHSLYVETLGELGLVGIVLLGGTLLLIIVAGFVLNARGRSRTLYAALIGAAVAWAIHNAVDWDWEIPATTIWLFALGGAALAGRPSPEATSEFLAGAYQPRLESIRTDIFRVLAAVACLGLAFFPATIAISQSRVDHAVAAFEEGDCPGARSFATDALATASWRPEPRVILAYCSTETGDTAAGVQEMRQALELDPRNSEYLYGYAQALAADGRDATVPIQEAVQADPANVYLAFQAAAFERAEGDPDALRQAAADSPRLDLTRGANTFEPFVIPAPTGDPEAAPVDPAVPPVTAPPPAPQG